MANFREYSSAADYCAIMDGDSMNPVFLPGDELFIRAQGFTEADAGRVMAFSVEGKLFIGYAYKREDGLLWASPANPQYEPMVVAPEQALGLVVGYTRHLIQPEPNEAPAEIGMAA